MKGQSRLSRLCGWSVRCISVVLALEFYSSAFAADPSKNVVASAKTQPSLKTTRKACYTFTSAAGFPVPCDRVRAIPTTASPIEIIRR
jgi:hypothetical protein